MATTEKADEMSGAVPAENGKTEKKKGAKRIRGGRDHHGDGGGAEMESREKPSALSEMLYGLENLRKRRGWGGDEGDQDQDQEGGEGA
jgi:hypothetical protein